MPTINKKSQILLYQYIGEAAEHGQATSRARLARSGIEALFQLVYTCSLHSKQSTALAFECKQRLLVSRSASKPALQKAQALYWLITYHGNLVRESYVWWNRAACTPMHYAGINANASRGSAIGLDMVPKAVLLRSYGGTVRALSPSSLFGPYPTSF